MPNPNPNPNPAPVTLTSIPVKVVGLPGYADEFDATLILEITRPTDGVHFSVVEAVWEGKVETIPVPSVHVVKPPTTFDLFVTTKLGRTFKSVNSPYAAREGARHTVATFVRCAPNGVSREEADTFADSVFTAPVGTPVTHGATGLTFRTEYTAAPKES